MSPLANLVIAYRTNLVVIVPKVVFYRIWWGENNRNVVAVVVLVEGKQWKCGGGDGVGITIEMWWRRWWWWRRKTIEMWWWCWKKNNRNVVAVAVVVVVEDRLVLFTMAACVYTNVSRHATH